MAATIQCTKNDGTMIYAEATATGAVTWNLEAAQGMGLPSANVPPSSTGLTGTTYWAKWIPIPVGVSYRVQANTAGEGKYDDQPVDFGKCSLAASDTCP